MTNHSNRWIKKARVTLIQIFGGKCWVCGNDNYVEFAHKEKTELKGGGRGRKERFYDVTKNPGSYVLICKACHATYDANPFKEDTEFKHRISVLDIMVRMKAAKWTTTQKPR